MQPTQDQASSPDERRIAIEALIARYPDLSKGDLAQVLRWFRKEATAYEVAMLASNEGLAAPYRKLRNEHLDRLTPSEKIAVGLLGTLVLGGLLALFAFL